MDPSVIVQAVSAPARRRAGRPPWVFTWDVIRKGDATMLAGATWTLHPDGTAAFDGTVISRRDGDAWVMRHVDLLGAGGAILGSLTTEQPVAGDWRTFVRDMPAGARRYRFRARAHFDAGLCGRVAHLKMYSSC
ncbi:DUF6294 family protein [Amycolatopsis australiensis]|uniref:DUF6294 domain-containing protein n=1 Tax=Amycolatopsis australiensis TaxID=546364 RepID=A0A1K1SDD1_9PSEU|nr:DUF6294 family protein [Amycolatopsis australiensis]SFW82326.1 hypothetical protein SAMN04489730_5387 [Amycolatopsis australiensis]